MRKPVIEVSYQAACAATKTSYRLEISDIFCCLKAVNNKCADQDFMDVLADLHPCCAHYAIILTGFLILWLILKHEN